MSQLMDAFRIGQMLGNAYGNMWVANANKRDDKKAERILNRLNSEGSEPEQKANPLTPTTEDYEQAMAANAETPSAANLQNVDLGNPLQQKAYDAIMGNKNLQPISTMAKNLGVRQNPLMDDVRKAIGVSTTISPEYEKERADVANAIAQGYTGNIDLSNRPRVRNEDGSISTVKSMSFNEDGKEVLIPQVSPDGKIMSEKEAIDRYRRTGENLGKFNTVAAANEMARRIHDSEEQKLNAQENTGLNWKPKFSAVDFEKAMKAEGMGKESRDRALALYKKDLAEQAQKAMLPDIVKAINDGNTRDALSGLLKYRQYDPETANILAKDYQSAIQYQRQQDMLEKRFANQVALQNNAFQNKVAYKGTVGSGSGGGRTTNTGFTIGDFNFKKGDVKDKVSDLKNQIKEKQKIIDGLDSGSPDYQTKKTILTSQRQELEKDLEAISNVRTDPQGYVQREYDKAKFDYYSKQPMDVNSYPSVKANIDKLIYDEGKPVWEVMDFLKSKMGDGPMYRQIANEYKDEKGRWTLGGLDLD